VIEPQNLGLTLIYRPAWPPAAAVLCRQPQIQTEYSAATLTGTLDLGGETSGWVLEAVKKLEALGRLSTGWDSYGGLPLKRGAKQLTLRVLRCLRKDELPVPAVVLGSAGTVQLEWGAKGKELEVELRDNDTIEYVKVSPQGEIEEGEAAHDLPEKLHELTGWLRRS
jgi:hypothetical protein